MKSASAVGPFHTKKTGTFISDICSFDREGQYPRFVLPTASLAFVRPVNRQSSVTSKIAVAAHTSQPRENHSRALAGQFIWARSSTMRADCRDFSTLPAVHAIHCRLSLSLTTLMRGSGKAPLKVSVSLEAAAPCMQRHRARVVPLISLSSLSSPYISYCSLKKGGRQPVPDLPSPCVPQPKTASVRRCDAARRCTGGC